MNTIIIHYSNGKTYTYKGWKLQNKVDWKHMSATLLPEKKAVVMNVNLNLPIDTIAIEVVSREERRLLLNPSYNVSVRTSILTVGRRVKENNKAYKKEQNSIKPLVVKPTTQAYNKRNEEPKLRKPLKYVPQRTEPHLDELLARLKWHHVADGDWEAIGKVNHYTISVSPKDFMFHLFVNGFVYGSEGKVEDLKQVAQDIEDNG